MIRLLGLVLSIGLADSLNPSTIGPALYLASGRRARTSVLKFAAGTFGVFLLGGMIIAVGPGRAVLALIPRPSPTARYILETAAGAAMLVVGVVLWRRRRQLGGGEGESRTSRFAGRSPTVLGATIAVIELPTAFPYFAAIVAVVGSGLTLWRQLVLLVIYNVCYVLPVLVIAGTVAIAGEGAVDLLARARGYLQEHWPVLVSVAALLAGAFVTLLGVTGITSGTPGRVGRLSRKVRHLITH